MKKRSIAILSGATFALLLFSGCTPVLPQPMPQKEAQPEKARMWDDTSTVESHYSLKPEPYSLESGQKDPELLGPQSTLKKNLEDQAVEEATGDSETFLAKEEPKVQASQNSSAHPPMDRSRCISLIGKAKFDEYTKRFGSETAAIRKCIILERVQKN